MPYKSVMNVIAVWFANGIAWIIALTPNEWVDGLQIIKELFAIFSLIIAISFTIYKWKQEKKRRTWIKKIGVYEIKNMVNKKSYIGSSTDIKQRFRKHRHLLKSNKHPNYKLQLDWNLFGEQNFLFSIKIHAPINDIKNLEYNFISKRKNIYNIIKTIDGKGYKQCGEALKNKSVSQIKISKEVCGILNPDRKGICKSVKVYDADKNLEKTFSSQKEAVKSLGGSVAKISRVLSENKLFYNGKIIIRGNQNL